MADFLFEVLDGGSWRITDWVWAEDMPTWRRMELPEGTLGQRRIVVQGPPHSVQLGLRIFKEVVTNG
jgi:hypothetical protein